MMDKTDELTLKISEIPNGFFWAVFTGDGSKPGSLRAASSTTNLSDAVERGSKEFLREVFIRDCEHDWHPWSTDSNIPKCSKCGIVDWREDG